MMKRKQNEPNREMLKEAKEIFKKKYKGEDIKTSRSKLQKIRMDLKNAKKAEVVK